MRLAAGKEASPDDWCRKAVREKLTAIQAQASRNPASSTAPAPGDRAGNQTQGGQPMTSAKFVLFLESVRLRWLLQEFLSC